MNELTTLLQSIKERADRATEGDWQHDLNGFIAIATDDGEWGETLLMTPRDPTEQNKRDADFAAKARTDVPRLVEAVRVLAEEIEKSRAISEAAGCTDNAQFLGSLLQRTEEILKGV